VLHALPADQMHVKVKNRLATIHTSIDDDAVTTAYNAVHLGNPASGGEKMAEDGFILSFDMVDGLDMFVWHDQHVRWSHRVNIAEGGHQLILIN